MKRRKEGIKFNLRHEMKCLKELKRKERRGKEKKSEMRVEVWVSYGGIERAVRYLVGGVTPIYLSAYLLVPYSSTSVSISSDECNGLYSPKQQKKRKIIIIKIIKNPPSEDREQSKNISQNHRITLFYRRRFNLI